MSRVDLEVVLGEPGPFVPGDVIEGFVGVTVNRDCTCRSVTVALQYYTHGRGNKQHIDVQTEVVFSGDLAAGERGLHPFTLTVPAGPFTYSGHNIHLDWRVRASADLSWARDAFHDERIVVEPGDAPLSRIDIGPVDLTRVTRGMAFVGVMRGLVGLFMVGMGSIFLVCFGFTAITLVLDAPSAASACPALIGVGVPMIFILIGLNMVGGGVTRLLAKRKLASFTVDAPDRVFPGEHVVVKVGLQPRGTLRVEEVRLQLLCEERATSGSGTNRRTYTHAVHEQTISVARPGTVSENGPTTFSADLVIPLDAPLSLAVRDNLVVWTLKAIADCPGPLDPEQIVALQVVPEAALGR